MKFTTTTAIFFSLAISFVSASPIPDGSRLASRGFEGTSEDDALLPRNHWQTLRNSVLRNSVKTGVGNTWTDGVKAVSDGLGVTGPDKNPKPQNPGVQQAVDNFKAGMTAQGRLEAFGKKQEAKRLSDKYAGAEKNKQHRDAVAQVLGPAAAATWPGCRRALGEACTMNRSGARGAKSRPPNPPLRKKGVVTKGGARKAATARRGGAAKKPVAKAKASSLKKSRVASKGAASKKGKAAPKRPSPARKPAAKRGAAPKTRGKGRK